ncbi:MAG: dephospho-CoA kinase [Prevotella sp.]
MIERIAITGGIGSGKSYVCNLLRERGIDVYDCDAGAKHVLATSEEVHERLTNLVGPDTYFPDGRLNKAAVAEFLLASESNKKAINAIVHPAVMEDFLSSGKRWMESAILFESGCDRYVDKVVAVTAPDEVRFERIVSRDGITPAKAREWIDCQMPQVEIIRRSDFEIINDGRHDVGGQLDNIIKNIFNNNVTDNLSNFR